MADTLTGAVADLLDQAVAAATSPTAARLLRETRTRLAEPLRLAIAGKLKAGKSTLLNALLGEELAATDAGECTRIVTWYRHGAQPEVLVHPHAVPAETRFFTREGALDVDLGRWAAEQVDFIEVRWPSERLRELTIIDTPGIASISTDVSQRTHRALTAEDERPPVADAVLYLLRHTHASDLRFLEAFAGDGLARGTPMNTVGVLARADEIGSCRLDALDVAARVAARYQAEPRLHRLCPIVVPVAGLLAYAGATLREPEYRALATVAGGSPAELAELLLTADRFAFRQTLLEVTELERQHLLGRLGLFGVRLAVELIRSGVAASATQLSAELLRRSGLDGLRGVLLRQFAQRSGVLKAQSALAALDAVLSQGGCRDGELLRTRLEEILSGAHAFAEVRTLNELYAGAVPLSDDRAGELERLLGGFGHDAATRLGLDPHVPAVDVRAAATAALARWQRFAEHPLAQQPARLAARVAVRTLEGVLADGGARGQTTAST